MCVHFVHDPCYAYLALRYIALLYINLYSSAIYVCQLTIQVRIVPRVVPAALLLVECWRL